MVSYSHTSKGAVAVLKIGHFFDMAETSGSAKGASPGPGNMMALIVERTNTA